MDKQTHDFHHLTQDELVHIAEEHGRFTTNDVDVECLRGCGGFPCPTRRLVNSVMAGRLVPSEELEQVGWYHKDTRDFPFTPECTASEPLKNCVPVYIRKEKP